MRTLLNCPVTLKDGSQVTRNVTFKRATDKTGTITHKGQTLEVILVDERLRKVVAK